MERQPVPNPDTNFGKMSLNAERALAQNDLNAEIEKRAASPEVSVLNDLAELQVYGSRGRTYKDLNGNVIASASDPCEGELAEIEGNPRYGSKEADRKAAAKQFETDLLDLTNDGLELCQAKLVMDLRGEDKDLKAQMVGNLIKNGMSATDAEAKADAAYNKMDAKRVKMIKEGGAFSEADYDKLKDGESLYSVVVPKEATGHAKMAAAAEKTIKANERKARIEARKNSAEAARLDDTAELEIFGNRGRTYLNSDGNVLADKNNPYKGRIETIRDDRSGGKTRQADRDMAADDYKTEVLGLTDEGFNLCQAKLIMDLREEDDANKPDFIAELIKNGRSAADAAAYADKVYAKKDAKRLKLIEEGGVLTEDEYYRVIDGEDLYPDPSATKPNVRGRAPAPTPDHVRAREVARNALNDPRGQDLLQEMGIALNEYSELLAKQEQKHFVSGKNKEALETARLRYEHLRNQVNGRMATELFNAGFNTDIIKNEIAIQDLGSQNGTRRGELGLIRDVTRAEAERIGQESRFVNWWVRQRGVKGAMAKAGVLAPAGVAAGAVAGVIAGPVTGAVAAGFFASRIAKGYMSARTSARARAGTNARQEANARWDSQLESLREEMHDVSANYVWASNLTGDLSRGQGNRIWSASNLTNEFTSGANDINSRNRRRLFGSVAAGAAFGGLGAAAADLIDGGINVNSPFSNDKDSSSGSGSNGGETSSTGGTSVDVDTDTDSKGGSDSGDDDRSRESKDQEPRPKAFRVEAGHGFTQEIQDQFPGHTPEQYLAAHQVMLQEFGSDYMEGVDTYMENGELRINAPTDNAHWKPGVKTALNRYFK